MKGLKVRLMEGMLGAELTSQQDNRRNGTMRKTLRGNDGVVPIDVPRDRDGSFEPELIRKGQTRIDGMDDKIIGLYAAGLSTRDIRAHLEEVYGLKVSADLPLGHCFAIPCRAVDRPSHGRNRGVEDILIAVVDGLKGFPDAIIAAFPETTVQTCIVHLVCHSLNFCGWKDRKNVA